MIVGVGGVWRSFVSGGRDRHQSREGASALFRPDPGRLGGSDATPGAPSPIAECRPCDGDLRGRGPRTEIRPLGPGPADDRSPGPRLSSLSYGVNGAQLWTTLHSGGRRQRSRLAAHGTLVARLRAQAVPQLLPGRGFWAHRPAPCDKRGDHPGFGLDLYQCGSSLTSYASFGAVVCAAGDDLAPATESCTRCADVPRR